MQSQSDIIYNLHNYYQQTFAFLIIVPSVCSHAQINFHFKLTGFFFLNRHYRFPPLVKISTGLQYFSYRVLFLRLRYETLNTDYMYN